jgi:GTP cyclohydrolase I
MSFLENIFNKRFFTKDTEKTEQRFIKALQEFNNFDEFNVANFTLFENKEKDAVIECKDIRIMSLCSHHLFPFTARVHIKYIANEKYCGLSKLPRVCYHYSRRPCSQEELTSNIFNFLKKNLQPHFLEVAITDGEHTCCSCRGINTQVNYNTKLIYGDKQ